MTVDESMMRRARPCVRRVAAAAGTLAIGVAAAGSGCSSGNNSDDLRSLCPSMAAAHAGTKPAAIALFSLDRLVRFSLESGRVEAERALPVGETPGSDPETAPLDISGRLLVQPADARVVLVLVRRAASARDEVLAVDPVTLRTRCRYPLAPGVQYRAIDVADSGRLYAFGYRERRDPKKVAAVLTTLEPRRGAHPLTEMVRPGKSDWFPWWGAVAPDEGHVVVTYHGSDTSGADMLEAADNGFRRCPSRECAGEVHGAAEPYGDGFLATDGSGMLDVGWSGRVEHLPLRPRNVHLMDFALDVPRGLVYVSSCRKRPAIQRLDLADMRVTDLPSGRFCGAPYAVYGDRYLILAASRVDEAGFAPDLPNELRVLDLRNPGSGVPVPDSGAPRDAIAIHPSG